MPITGTVPLTGKIAPTSDLDTYPVTDPKYGLGGLRSVGTTAARNAISYERREQGMMVYVEADQNFYALVGGTSDSNWVLFTPSGLGPAGPTGATGPTGPQILLIDSFSTTIDQSIPKGSANHSLSSETITLSYAGGVVPSTGGIYLTDPTKGTGFPVYFPTSAMNSVTFSGQTLTGAVGDTITLRIVVTGSAGSSDYYDYPITVSNYIRWGATGASSLTGNQIHTVLTNYSVSESLSQEFKLQVSAGSYIYLSYPSRLGVSVQSINNAGYGGMALQGQMMVTGSPQVSTINPEGFSDQYFVYRSEHMMGTGTLFVKTAAK